MALTRTLIRHAPTDYNSLFLRGLPASLDAEDARRYFCDRGYKCTVSFNKINNEYYKLYVALQFESEKMARDVFNKYDNEQVLGYNVGLSYYKDKARLYHGRDNRDSSYDHRRARVGQPVDRRRFNRTPSPSRRRRSRSRRSRSGSRHSDSDRSHRSRSHSGSSSPRSRNRSKSKGSDKRRSRTHSSSSSPSSPRTSRKRSKSPKESSRKSVSPYNGTRKSRRSASPYDGTRKRRHSRQSLSPNHDATVRSVITKRTSPSPERNVKSLVNYSHSPPPRSRRRTFSGHSTSSSSESEHGSPSPKSSPKPTKKKLSPSPSRSDSAPSPGPSNDSEGDDSPSPTGEKKRHSSGEIHSSPERKVPEDKQPALDQTPKDAHKRHSRHSSSRKRSKEHRRRGEATERGDLSSERECKSKVPPKASTLSSSIYGKVASFTDMNIQQANQTPHKNGKRTNGSKREDPEDVEADLRAEFLNNNDALYDSHERMQAAGFPLVTKKKAEEAEMILDDLPGDIPIDPLTDGHQYVRNSVEEGFALTNGGSDELPSKDDVWTPEMLTKLKVKKEEIIQAYKQDCDTFTTVVKMLIGKEADLEMRLQHALKENLKDIGQRCVQELNQLADKLKAEAKQ